jgi:hypothetical protein
MDRFLPHLNRVAVLLFPAILYPARPAYNGTKGFLDNQHMKVAPAAFTPGDVTGTLFC